LKSDGRDDVIPTNHNQELTYAPVVADGAVYFCDWEGRNLHALDIRTGKVKWRFRVKVYHSPTPGGSHHPAVGCGTVYFGSQNGYFYAVDITTGKQRWKFNARPTNRDISGELSEQEVYVVFSPVVSEGIVLCSNKYGDLWALDCQTGRLKWRFNSPRQHFGWIDRAQIADGLVCILLRSWQGEPQVLYLLDVENGKQKNEFKLGKVRVKDFAAVNRQLYMITAADANRFFGEVRPVTFRFQSVPIR